jgi:hypothetical protein
MEVGLDRVRAMPFEGGLGAEHARRPVGLGVDAPEQPNSGWRMPGQRARMRSSIRCMR